MSVYSSRASEPGGIATWAPGGGSPPPAAGGHPFHCGQTTGEPSEPEEEAPHPHPGRSPARRPGPRHARRRARERGRRGRAPPPLRREGNVHHRPVHRHAGRPQHRQAHRGPHPRRARRPEARPGGLHRRPAHQREQDAGRRAPGHRQHRATGRRAAHPMARGLRQPRRGPHAPDRSRRGGDAPDLHVLSLQREPRGAPGRDRHRQREPARSRFPLRGARLRRPRSPARCWTRTRSSAGGGCRPGTGSSTTR
jgi:hypothetical protein